ncbi:MAG: hypothetical protein GIKADHBN_03706 [Phycisphaerales bacterium]|nr:hypothetical protein [Phycisphaerales bacterium]
MAVDQHSPRSWPVAPLRLRLLGRLLASLSLAFTLLAATPARAQLDTLPDSVTDNVSPLSQAQEQTVRQYTEKYLSALETAAADPEGTTAAEDARRKLVAPLTRNTTSTTFRLEYSRQLMPRLRAMTESKNKNLVTQALQITGELATEAAVEATEALLDSSEEDVRFMAAAGLRRTFVAVSMASPAIDETNLKAAATALGKALTAEKSTLVAFAMTDALVAAVSTSRENLSGLRSTATIALANALGQRVRALNGAMPDVQDLQGLIKAATSFRDELANGRLDSESAKAAAGFAGDLHVNITKVIKKAGLPQSTVDSAPARGQAVQMALLADQIITFAAQKRGDRGPAVDLSNRLRSGEVNDDALYANGVTDVVGRLTGPTFGLDATRFR